VTKRQPQIKRLLRATANATATAPFCSHALEKQCLENVKTNFSKKEVSEIEK